MTEIRKRTTRSARRFMLVALLAVLGAAVGGVYLAVAAQNPPPPPTISSAPAARVNVTTASFTYTDAVAVTKFQCSLDGGAFVDCGTTRPSSKTYTGLSVGSHTFQVRAFVQQGNQTSAPTSYTWVIDQTPPTVVSINRASGTPTNAASLSWAVTFSEPVTGVDATDFALVASGVTGAGSISVSGSGASYTVTANSGSGNGTLGLNLNDNDSIVDLATNRLGGAGAGNGNFTGQVYSIDKTRPTLTSFTRSGTSPTNAGQVSWTLIFSEPITGLSASNFTVSQTGITGTTAVTGVAGSGTTWTVTASTGTGTPSGTGTLNLNFVNSTGVADAAGNTLNTTLPVSGGAYTIDHLAPPVAFTNTPPDPNTVSTSHFAWVSSPQPSDFARFECSTENGPFSTQVHSADPPDQPCASPLTYVVETTNNGQHQFAVRAYDTRGNFTQINYSWRVEAGSIQDFTIDGNAVGLLYPGGVARSLAVTFHNPNNIPIFVTSASVALRLGDFPAGCTSSPFVLTQASIPAAGVQVPANGQVTLPAQGATAPSVRMQDSGNQDACKNLTFHFDYSGSAHS